MSERIEEWERMRVSEEDRSFHREEWPYDSLYNSKCMVLSSINEQRISPNFKCRIGNNSMGAVCEGCSGISAGNREDRSGIIEDNPLESPPPFRKGSMEVPKATKGEDFCSPEAHPPYLCKGKLGRCTEDASTAVKTGGWGSSEKVVTRFEMVDECWESEEGEGEGTRRRLELEGELERGIAGVRISMDCPSSPLHTLSFTSTHQSIFREGSESKGGQLEEGVGGTSGSCCKGDLTSEREPRDEIMCRDELSESIRYLTQINNKVSLTQRNQGNSLDIGETYPLQSPPDNYTHRLKDFANIYINNRLPYSSRNQNCPSRIFRQRMFDRFYTKHKNPQNNLLHAYTSYFP